MDVAGESWVVGLLLTGARVLPVCVLLAALTRAVVPWPVALSLALSLALGFAAPVATLELASPALVGAGLRELALGFAYALCTLLPVLSLGWAARLAQHIVPGLSGRSAPLARLYALTAVFTFVSLSGHRALVMGLSTSLRDLPLGTLSLDRALLALEVAGFVMDAFGFAVALALPLVVSVWLAGAVVALAARALGTAPALDGTLRGPLFVLVAALLLAPLSARTPEAMRAGLDEARALIARMVR